MYVIDFARGMELLTQYAGMRCVKGGTRVISHSWNIVKIENKWYHLDVTWGLNQTNHVEQMKHFLKSDSVYNQSHSKNGIVRPWNCSGYRWDRNDRNL